LTSPFSRYDDLEIVSGGSPDPGAFPLVGILRNEMYFLPAFLEHYRARGIGQFILLNDRSDDGTTEFLAAQPDVVQLRSGYRYGDVVEAPSGVPASVIGHGGAETKVRILYVWRSLLMERFAADRWALQVDMDEFVHLPPGLSFPKFVDRPSVSENRLVLAAMLDVYPSDIATLRAQRDEEFLDPDGAWFFDGEPHLDMGAEGYPAIAHPGARARLYLRHGVYRQLPELAPKKLRGRLSYHKSTRLGLRVPKYNSLEKPVLVRWPKGAAYFNSHKTSLDPARHVLLPMVHYRFTGRLYAKIRMALDENSYSSGSRDHRFLEALIDEMERADAGFLYRRSRRLGGFTNFVETGNALGV
jgi:hypothetical protein